MDFSKISNIEFYYNTDDYPDFSDAFILNCDYDGRCANECELDKINKNKDFIHEKLIDQLY